MQLYCCQCFFLLLYACFNEKRRLYIKNIVYALNQGDSLDIKILTLINTLTLYMRKWLVSNWHRPPPLTEPEENALVFEPTVRMMGTVVTFSHRRIQHCSVFPRTRQWQAPSVWLVFMPRDPIPRTVENSADGCRNIKSIDIYPFHCDNPEMLKKMSERCGIIA